MTRALHNVQLMSVLHKVFDYIPDYERILEHTYRKLIRSGDVVVDIGAHAGRHTAVFADIVGPTGFVHAFEPLPEAIGYFEQRHLTSNVRLYKQAVGNQRGEVSFVYARGTPEESGFRTKTYNRPDLVQPETISVKVSPLDDFIDVLGNVAFLKIDAEGAEIACLESGAGVIAKSRPWITVEYGYPGYSAYGLTKRSLFDRAQAMNYVIGDLFGGVCDTLETWEHVCDAAYWDWYLVPHERVDEWVQTTVPPMT